MNLPVPIDNEPILRQALRRAKDCFRRAEQLEAALERFEAVDLKRYGVWHQQTFGDTLNEIECKRRDLIRLAEIHNQVICVANTQAMSMARAYRFVLDEDHRFANGTDEERRAILNDRRLRQAWLNDVGGAGDDRLGDVDEGADDGDVSEDGARDAYPEFDSASAEDGDGDGGRFETGAPADLFQYAKHQSAARSDEDRRLRLKSLFRLIARQVHPDSIDAGLMRKSAGWLRRVWGKAVVAHGRGDLDALTAVHGEILLATHQLAGLNLADIRTVVTAVSKAHALRQIDARDVKKSPAWNFSKLKSTEKLKIKIRRAYAETLGDVDAQIDHLRDMQRAWARAGTDARPRRSRAQTRARRW